MPLPARTDDDIPAKLDAILLHLERLDRRDRMRTWAGVLHTLVAIVPMLFFIYASWYAATHADEIIRKISDESAKAASKYAEQQSADMLQRLQNLVPSRR